MIIVYEGFSGEILITTQEKEEDLLSRYFGEGSGRNLDDYDRYLCDDVIELTPSLEFRCNNKVGL